MGRTRLIEKRYNLQSTSSKFEEMAANDIRIEDLRVFEAVAREAGFSGAARSLGQTPSAITRSIERLERAVRSRLFHRSTRAVSPTAEGERLRPVARRMLADAELAEQVVADTRDQVTGTLRLTASATFARLYLSPVLAELTSRYPALTYDLTLTDRTLDLVDAGLDLAIRIGPLADSDLIAVHLADEFRWVCASPGYLEQHGAPQRPDDLREHQCIALSQADSWTFVSRGRARAVRVPRTVATDFGAFALQAAEDGLGLAQLPSWLSGPSIAAGRLVRVLERYELPGASAITMLYPSRERVPPRVTAFVELAKSIIRPALPGE